jgi:UDP-glucose 4-epimerase
MERSDMSAPTKPSLLGQDRILVTGASGFIGSHLVRRLVAMGAEVTALSRTPGRLAPMLDQIRFEPCDLLMADRVREVVHTAQPKIIFHLAAHPDAKESASQMYATLDANIVGTANLLEALQGLPSVSLIYGDSAKVYGNSGVPYRATQAQEPLSSYAVAKVAAWGLIDVYRRVHGIMAVGLRPTLVYGPGQGFNLFTALCNAIKEARPEIGLDGGIQTRDPLYIDDVIDALLLVADQRFSLDGRTLPIGGNREISVKDLAQLTVDLLGAPQKVVTRPTHVRPTETMRSWCDNAEARAAMGWSPRTSLEEGIVLTARAMGIESPARPPQAAKAIR